MLPPFIIEQIRRREEREAEERRRREAERRPRLEIPADVNQPARDGQDEDEDPGKIFC